MNKGRNLLIVVVFNIFLTLLFTVVLEYMSLSDRFRLLENNVHIALETALDASMASEEMFSNEYQEYVTSVGRNTGNDVVGSSVLVYDDTQGNVGWYGANAYVLAMTYESNGHKLPTQSQYNLKYASLGGGGDNRFIANIFTWMFGDVGQGYDNFEWANQNRSLPSRLASVGIDMGSRAPNVDFGNFYTNIGNKIKTKANLKVKVGDSFEVQEVEYSVLDNMGLTFGGNSLTSNTSTKILDNFTMSFHAGKINASGSRSAYFLTPYSLGVTYVPVKVLKPVFIANLDTMARLQKASSGKLASDSELKATFKSASDCIPTSIYDVDSNLPKVHDSNSNIVTDGVIEYDLDSVKVKVDYFLANFYSGAHKNVAAKIEGTVYGNTSNQSLALNSLVNNLKASDTMLKSLGAGNYSQDDIDRYGNRIVAKVTVRLKAYIVYQSPILQWLSHNDWLAAGSRGTNHYSIKTIDTNTGKVLRSAVSAGSSNAHVWSNTSDGVWYQYSTYVAISR